MDVAMPVVIANAEDFGLTGYEASDELDANVAFFERMESIRREAGMKMGMGDVTNSVTPKFAILAPARHSGTITARYFVPRKTHPTMAVTGAQCLASCALTPGSVSDGLLERPNSSPTTVVIEHPGGSIDVLADFGLVDGKFSLNSAGLIRTTRKLADGNLFIPSSIWDNK